MKPTSLLFLFFTPCFIFLVFAASAFAKTGFSQSFSDYQYQFGLYRDAHKNYSLGRNAYLKNKTLSNKQAAFEATREMLALRAKTLDTYFIAININFLDTNPDQETQEKTLAVGDGQRMFFRDHQEKLQKTTTLEEALAVSKELDDRWPATRLAAYQILTITILGKQENLYKDTQKAFSQTEEIIDKMEKGGENTAKLKVWARQIQDKLGSARDKEQIARKQSSKFSENPGSPQDLFASFKESMAQANKETVEAISFLHELLREIKSTGRK